MTKNIWDSEVVVTQFVADLPWQWSSVIPLIYFPDYKIAATWRKWWSGPINKYNSQDTFWFRQTKILCQFMCLEHDKRKNSKNHCWNVSQKHEKLSAAVLRLYFVELIKKVKLETWLATKLTREMFAERFNDFKLWNEVDYSNDANLTISPVLRKLPGQAQTIDKDEGSHLTSFIIMPQLRDTQILPSEGSRHKKNTFIGLKFEPRPTNLPVFIYQLKLLLQDCHFGDLLKLIPPKVDFFAVPLIALFTDNFYAN